MVGDEEGELGVGNQVERRSRARLNAASAVQRKATETISVTTPKRHDSSKRSNLNQFSATIGGKDERKD